MRDSLSAGLQGTFRYRVPEAKTVPYIYEEAQDFQQMPRVFATGFMVALVEWACIDLVKPHLDWPREQTLGTHVDLSHVAATLPGMTVEVTTTLERVEGRKLVFSVSARDDLDLITEGRHERMVVDRQRFEERLAVKRSRVEAA